MVLNIGFSNIQSLKSDNRGVELATGNIPAAMLYLPQG